MNKKDKNIELKIYELLGVKIFRKMAFWLYDKVWILLTLKMSKEERKKYIYNTRTNYNLGKVNSLEDIKNYKKYLFMNAGLHIVALTLCIPNFLKVIAGTTSILNTIRNLSAIIINIYCIMLQRYNLIRINEVIKKGLPREEKKKNELKDKIKKSESLLNEHNYKIVNKKGKEKNITFEELIEDATIEELKRYREHLVYFLLVDQYVQQSDIYLEKQQVDIVVPIKKHKSLKLELKLNKHNNGL